MPWFVKARSFFRNLLFWQRVEADLDAEVRSHLEMLTEENVRAGMAAAEARRAARIELGGIEQVKEQVRSERIGGWLQSVIAEFRFALRQLRKSPGFTAVTVLTLALGIGANTAIFSVVNSVLLRSLPFSHPSELLDISARSTYFDFTSLGLRSRILPTCGTPPGCSPPSRCIRIRRRNLQSTGRSAWRLPPFLKIFSNCSVLARSVGAHSGQRTCSPAAVR